MTKKYKLLKDLPEASAGDIYVKEGNSDRYRNSHTLTQKSPVIEHNSYFTWQVENNPSWFQEIKEDKPQWEILSFKHNNFIYNWSDAGYYYRYAGELGASLYYIPKDSQILSVKRLSDGEVFTVGNNVGVIGEQGVYKISGWSDSKYIMYALFNPEINNGLVSVPIYNLRKAKEPEMVRVVNLSYDYFRSKDCMWADTYEFRISSKKLISVDKFPSIKKAIEDCLNETPTTMGVVREHFGVSKTKNPDPVLKMVGYNHGKALSHEFDSIRGGYNKFDGYFLNKLEIKTTLDCQEDFNDLILLLNVHKHCFKDNYKQQETPQKTYTQQEMDEAGEKVFTGARVLADTSKGVFYPHPHYYRFTSYKEFKNYLSSLKK